VNAAAALDKGFAHLALREMPQIGHKTPKNQENPQKTCGNRPFAVDKAFEKPQGKRRWVLSDPHKHRAFPARAVECECGEERPSAAIRGTLHLGPV
jgi:hypothetical protein